MAMVHALSHLGDHRPANAPGQHALVCTDCVGHATLLVTGGAAVFAFFLAFQRFRAPSRAVVRSPHARLVLRAFRSRAPPR